MIKIEQLVKSFNKQFILNGLDLCVKQGEVVVILGSSGTGKSVLLKHIVGLLKPDSGKLFIDNVDITNLSERKLLKVRRQIGYLFQEGALYDFMNVFDNLAFPLKEHTKLKSKVIREKVKQFLEMVDLHGVENKYPSELSGGMKKRVGLARAMILDAKVLLCDEPTSGLDPIRSRYISDMIRRISKEMNCATVITSHDIDNAFRVADRLVLLNEGKIVAQGTKEDLMHSDNKFVREFIAA